MHTKRIKTSILRVLAQKTASRFAAWTCCMAIAVLSLAPAEHVTRHANLRGHVKHVLAYAVATLITAAAYGERGVTRVMFALLTYAGGLEFLQRFSPGRTSRLGDCMFSGAGVLMGVGVYVLLRMWLSGANELPSRSSATGGTRFRSRARVT
jgi:VanZ like family